MKKSILILLSISILILSIGCENSKTEYKEFPEGFPPEMILVHKSIWVNTGKKVTGEIDDIVISGEIESIVERIEVPTQDGQSNFEIKGNKYAQYENKIIVSIENEWILFITLEDWNKENANKGPKIQISYANSDKEEIFGDLNDEIIQGIIEKIASEVEKDKDYEKDFDEAIEKVFKDSGLDDILDLEAAKSKIYIYKSE